VIDEAPVDQQGEDFSGGVECNDSVARTDGSTGPVGLASFGEHNPARSAGHDWQALHRGGSHYAVGVRGS
jgi:hypothetical protein